MKPCLTIMLVLLMSDAALAQQVQRCQQEDGSIRYTERPCEAHEKILPSVTTNPASKPALARQPTLPPPACSAAPDDLLDNVQSAIIQNDVNQLIKNYHWPGVSQSQSEHLLDRLQAIADRPLLDAHLVYPEENRPPKSGNVNEIALDAQLQPPQEAVRLPYALKIMQSQNTGETLTTVFRLQRHYLCWWIRF